MQTGLPILDQLTIAPLQTVLFLLAVILAVTIHEFAHAFAAARQGDQTARLLGRVSLNPLRHLDLAGSFLFLFAGIGYGKPVPVNPANLKDGRRGDFYVSIAGIATNLIAAFVFFLPFQIISLLGGDISPNAISGNLGLLICQIMAEVNILLAAFNLLPIPPLDGSKAIGLFVPRRLEAAYQEYLRVGPIILIGIFLLMIILRVNLISPILDPLLVAFKFLTFLPASIL